MQAHFAEYTASASSKCTSPPTPYDLASLMQRWYTPGSQVPACTPNYLYFELQLVGNAWLPDVLQYINVVFTGLFGTELGRKLQALRGGGGWPGDKGCGVTVAVAQHRCDHRLLYSCRPLRFTPVSTAAYIGVVPHEREAARLV